MRCAGVLLVLLLSPAVSACGGSGQPAKAGKVVVAAFYPLAWAAEQIGGETVDVVNLTPPGAEPHDIELSPGDMQIAHDADLVLYVGEGFMSALEDAVQGRDNAVDLLAGEPLLAGGGGRGVDPHVWLDPKRYAALVVKIAAALGEPEAGAALSGRLEHLDGELRRGLDDCKRHEIVTSHAAFGYLAGAYGLEQIALTGLSPEAEPSPRALEALVDQVEKRGATTVFFETLVSPRLAETVAREAGVDTAALDPIEGLDEEELARGADYFSVMRENLAALRKALGCR